VVEDVEDLTVFDVVRIAGEQLSEIGSTDRAAWRGTLPIGIRIHGSQQPSPLVIKPLGINRMGSTEKLVAEVEIADRRYPVPGLKLAGTTDTGILISLDQPHRETATSRARRAVSPAMPAPAMSLRMENLFF
jgi:hypothetical protein